MNTPSLNFGFQFVYDGSSSSVSVELATGPVFFFLPSPSTPVLNGTLSIVAAGVESVTCDTFTVTTTTLALGVLTVNFTGTSTAGTVCTVTGVLKF